MRPTVNDAQHAAPQTPARSCVRITITAAQLHALHNARHPFVLQGDHRTSKSNAMKTRDISCGASWGSVAFNPNAGACREKILGLPAHPVMWSQQISLIAPTRRQREQSQHNSHEHPTPTANHWFLECPCCHSRGFGRVRVRKLFMVLCTEEEARDAALADTWLRQHDHMIRPHRKALYALRTTLIKRYGPLLPPRSLACRKCLGIRYGELKRSQ